MSNIQINDFEIGNNEKNEFNSKKMIIIKVQLICLQ